MPDVSQPARYPSPEDSPHLYYRGDTSRTIPHAQRSVNDDPRLLPLPTSSHDGEDAQESTQTAHEPHFRSIDAHLPLPHAKQEGQNNESKPGGASTYFVNRGVFSEEQKSMIQLHCDEPASTVLERLQREDPAMTQTYRQVKGAVENERRESGIGGKAMGHGHHERSR